MTARLVVATAAALVIGTALGCAQTPTLVTGVEWQGRGVWLRADFHTHTKFTDGSKTIDEIVAAAGTHGCNVVAITDHGDGNLKGATPEYFDAIAAARAKYPDITVITAMEWNVPPGKGQEHATILFPSAMANLSVLGPFKERFDDEVKEGENPELAVQGFAALKPEGTALAPVVFFNHPNRRPASTSLPALTFEALKKGAPSILVGFEGAPGHQRGTPLGSYPEGVTLVDRWDPMAASLDGLWDEWLRKGLDVWGAIANSDFHDPPGDYWPCEFASTRVYAPDRTADGIIKAVRAGSFFAEHGRIVSVADLEARFEGLARSVHAGETVVAPRGSHATVTLQLEVPAVDYLDRPNKIDQVELIGVTTTKTESLFAGAPEAAPAFTVDVVVPTGGIVLRARGRRLLDDGSALSFYTNPIRINAR